MGHVVIYVVSDIYSRLEMFYEANASVVGSRFMQCLLKSHLRLTNIYWLEDTVESPQELRKDVYTTDKDLSAVWFGCCNENYRFAKAVEKSILSTSGWRFTYITGPGGEPGDVPYSVDTVYQEIIKHDVVYIPTAITLIGQCKSAGRAIFAQQLAMPVITGSIYSYVRHIDPFVTGLVCYIDDDWRQNFNMLKQPEYREYLGNNARESVKDRFTAEVHAVKWRNIIEEILCLRETR
jgi:glycosyltransferase involved in cell wall biosynthesis